MGKLVFRVASDWQEVVRLRTEIEKLKQTLFSMDSTQSPDTFKKLNAQLGENSKKMNTLIYDAAKAGATMENDFKKGIYDGEKAVNSLSEEIIKQKDIIRETQNDVSMLTEQYKKLGKYDPKRQSLSDELNRAKAALGEQKYALGELQSQQALARLSTKALKDEYALFKDESKAVITTNDEVGVSFKKMLATIGGIAMLKQVASNVVSTAGMFQKYESVLTNALDGSSDKAKAYLSDINSFAAKTNFQLDELTDDFIKFVNRGVTPSMDAMKRMGDFTNTVAKPFDQLTEAILDINNPERWKEFGVRVQTEGNKVKLSFRDMAVECDRTVESVMKAVEQFGSMKGVEGSTEAIAKTIEGQMSNLEDTITTALAEIGLANQDLISGSISAVDTIVKNYDIIGKSILALIEIYGIYRAGLLINTIVEQGSVKSIWAKITATKAATVAQAAYNKVLAMNPYVAVGMAVVSLGIAVYTLADHTTYAEKTARSAAESMEKMKNASENLKNKINELLSVIRDETSTQYKKTDAYLKLQKILPEVFKNMDIEKIKLMDKLSLLEQINKASDRREIIGAKTNVVLAQKEVDKINALIAADSKRGTYSGQYEIQLSDAKSKLEAAKKVVADIEKIQAEANRQKEAVDKKVVIKNKEFWTTQKKEAETALNSIASSQKKLMDAGNFKGIDDAVVNNYKDNVRKLKEAEKELKVYDLSSKQENQAKKEAEKKRKQQEQLAEQLLSLRRKSQQDEVNLMAEGTQKKLSQIDLDYQKELDAIEKQRTEWEKTQKGKLTSEQESQLSISEENAFKAYQKSVSETNKEKLESDRKAWQEYFIQFGNYQEKRKNLIQKYDDEIAKLEEHSAERATKIAEKNQAIDQLDEQFGKSIHVMADLFEDASEKSVSSIQDIIDKYELLIKYMSGTDESVSLINLESVGFTDKDIANLENGTINIKDITDAIKRLKEEVKGKSPWLSFFSDMKKGIDDIKNANGDTRKLGQGISTIGGAITEFSPAIKQFGSDISSIFGEDLNDEINNVIDGLSGLGQTAVGVGQIMSGDIAGGIMSAVSGVSQLVNAMGNLFGPDGTAYYEGVKEQLEAINEVYDRIIDKSKEDIVFGGGFTSVQAATQAMDNYEKKVINLQKIAAASGRAGASWKSHSAEWHSNKNVGAIGGFEQMSDILGKSISSMTDLYSLSGDELFLIQSQMPEAWSLIDARIRENLDSIVACKDEANELRDALNQAMTGVDFDSFYNGFIDQLSDMDTSFEDMCDNFEDYLRKSIMAGLVASQYQDRINALYEQWSDAAQSDKKITEEEANALKNQYRQIVNDMMRDREEMAKSFGWDASVTFQESSKKVSASVTQDSIDEVSGRFTALQIAGEEIKNQSITQSQSLNILTMKTDTLISINTETRKIADDTRDLIASSYLELVQISENTGAIIKPIQQMQKDMAEVKNNTKGLSTK
jgi:hypothetical protein